ncbi:MAG: hypothetical protein OEW21_15530 [Betaproteobacteria bacterium]|nr:hypothetical protein [Betaproteobacteria bacterium]
MRIFPFSLAWFLALAVSAGTVLGAEEAASKSAQRWVRGSWLDVYSAADAKAAVRAKIVANTSVKLVATAQKFCEIEWEGAKRGFISCEWLGEAPLVLEEIGQKDLPGKPRKPNPKYAPLHAFWIEPSLKRLQEAGKYLEETLLSPAQRKAEAEREFDFVGDQAEISQRRADALRKLPGIKRHVVPELEAMKTVMGKGVTAPKSYWRQPISWEAVSVALKQGPATSKEVNQALSTIAPGLAGSPPQIWLYQHLALPAIKASYFKSSGEIGGPREGYEALSAQFNIPYRVRILGKPEWKEIPRIPGGHNIGVFGFWDVGPLEIALTNPVYETAVDLKGNIAVAKTYAKKTLEFDDSRLWCNDDNGADFREWFSAGVLPNYPSITKSVVFFRTKEIPRLRKASVETRSRPIRMPAEIAKSDGNLPPGDLDIANSLDLVDLDGDKVPDLAVWVFALPYDGPGEQNSKFVFVNLNGIWHLFDIEYTRYCG